MSKRHTEQRAQSLLAVGLVIELVALACTEQPRIDKTRAPPSAHETCGARAAQAQRPPPLPRCS
jgi:hypothetical protein